MTELNSTHYDQNLLSPWERLLLRDAWQWMCSTSLYKHLWGVKTCWLPGRYCLLKHALYYWINKTDQKPVWYSPCWIWGLETIFKCSTDQQRYRPSYEEKQVWDQTAELFRSLWKSESLHFLLLNTVCVSLRTDRRFTMLHQTSSKFS